MLRRAGATLRTGLLAGVLIGLVAAAPATAQTRDETLADIRQDLTLLYGEIRALSRELSTTSGPATLAPGSGVLERVDAIEAELQRLTARTEELEFRISEIVRDGTNRIGDLEFRLCELEPGCDIAALGDTPSLGGAAAAAPAPTPAPTPAPGATRPQLAVGETAAFAQARAALEAGDARAAADAFAAFTETYPGSPLMAEAQFQRGAALAQLGETAPAARAYLQAFSLAPDGPFAGQALYEVGMALAALGQQDDACATLAEVGVRFPAEAVAAAADAERSRLGCP